MANNLAGIDWVIIFIYLGLVIIGGTYFTRRAHKGLSEYFLSGRSLPWWLAGTSMVATSFSCDTPLYVTKLVRTGGIWLNWQWWGFAVGGMLGAFLLSKLWRRALVLTDVELTELRYGGKSAAFLRGFRAFYLAIPVNCIAMGWVLLAMAKISAVLLDWDKWFSVTVFTASAFIYSLTSGLWGVVVTDLIQFIWAMTGAIILALFAVQAAGGMDEIIAYIASRPESYAETLKLVPSMTGSGGLLSASFIGFGIYILVQWWANLNSDGGGKVIQRINACKNEEHALGSFLFYNFAHFALRSWPWILAALASIKLYPTIADAEMAYPQMIVDILPAGFRGVVVASLVAAFMSTIDTQMNWGASYLINDLYKRYIRPGKSERHYLSVAKWAVLISVILAGLAAYYTESVTSAFQFIIAFGAGTGLVYILRWFWWRINAWTEISAMIASSVISIALYLTTDMDFALKVLITAGGSAVVWVIVAYLTPPVEREVLKNFYLRVRPGGFWKPVKELAGVEADTLGPAILNWVMGTAVVLGLTTGLGKFLMYRDLAGGAILICSLILAFLLYFRINPHTDQSAPRRMKMYS